jgi:hypothetical protein
VYSDDNSATRIANGGNNADTAEYFNDDTNDYTFDFTAIDGSKRGEYLILGSDSQFEGLNVQLATLGIDSSADLDWTYWNGSAWADLTVFESAPGVSKFTASGSMYFDAPGNWMPYALGIAEYYAIRAHLASGSYSTDPVEDTIRTDILLFHYLNDLNSTDQKFEIPGVTNTDKGSDPIAVWHMDEGYGTTISDSTTGANNLTLSGATWQGTATDQQSQRRVHLRFDGSNDFLSRTNDADFNFGSGGFSISGWFRHSYTAPSSGTDTILSHFGTAGYKVYMNTSGFICFGIDGDSTWTPADSACSSATQGSYADSAWHHFEAIKNGTTSILLYIDGHQVGSDTSLSATGSLNSASTLYIGIDSDGTSNPWEGELDEIAFYNYTRTATQVAVDMRRPQTAVVFGETANSLNSGLVAYWKLDENTGSTTNDSSGNSNNSNTFSGNATWTSGKFGSGITFDGTDDAVVIPDTPSTNLGTTTDSYTVSTWFKTTTDFSTSVVLVSNLAGNTYPIRLGITSSETIHFEFRNSVSAFTISNSSTPLNDGSWHHVVGIRSVEADRSFLYVDGILVDSDVDGTDGSMVNGQDFVLGNTSTLSQDFNGQIDETRIYRRALSPAEVVQLYNWAPGPIAHYKLDDGTGQSPVDSSSNGYTGTLGTDTSAGADDPAWSNGKFGDALRFDGGDFAKIDNAALNNICNFSSSGGFSVSAWFKFASAAANNAIFMMGSSSTNTPICGLSSSSGAIRFEYRTDNNTEINGGQAYVTDTTYSDGNWHHASVVKNGTQFLIYVDGALQKTLTDASGFNTLTANQQTIGASRRTTTASYFDGNIDDVRVYNYARTADQVMEDMNGGHPLGGSPIGSQIAYWAFDEVTGQQIRTRAATSLSALRGTTSGVETTDPTWLITSSCKIGNCLDFDGNLDVVTVQSATAIDMDSGLQNGFTFTAWIYADGPGESSAGQIFNKGTNNWLRVDTNFGGNLDIQGNLDLATTDATLNISAPIATGTWNHVAMSYTNDADDEISIWVNGIKRGTSTDGSGSPTDTGDLLIGGASTNNFDGRIDEFKVYSSELTESEMLIDFTANSIANFGTGTSERNDLFDGAAAEPVGWWPLNENTGTSTTIDISTNENDGGLASFTESTWMPGVYGSAVNLDGSTQYIDMDDQAELDISDGQDLTVMAWVYRDTDTTDDVILSDGLTETNTQEGYILWIDGATDDVRLRVGDGADYFVVDSTSTITTPGWNHVVAIFDESSDSLSTIYINGVEDRGGTSGVIANEGSPDNGRDFRVGTNVSSSDHFDGRIDDVKVFKSVLTPARIAYEYNRGKPVGWWKLDDCTGTTAYDASGRGNNGTITIGSSGTNTAAGSCSSGSGSEAWNNGTDGKRNNSLDFDGTDDYISMGDVDALDITSGSDLSLSAWVKRNSFNTIDTIIAKNNDTTSLTSDGYYLMIHPNDSVWFVVGNGGTQYCNVLGGLSITDSNWHHVAATFDGSSGCSLYIDGVEQVGTFVSPGSPDNALDFRIGAESDGGEPFDGQIDDVRVYKYVLSHDQIKKVMHTGAAYFGPEEGAP